MRTCIIIPTYNEAENISRLLDELLRIMPEDTSVLVIDDGSPDGTADIVRRHIAHSSRIALMIRPAKLGIGSAYQAAFYKVLDEGYADCIVTMDADFSHSPRYVPELVKNAETHDLIIGSRYVTGGRIENWELWRRALSRGGNLYVRLITGLPIRDCTAGFSCMRTDFLRRIPFGRVKASGYAWWFTLRMMFFRRGARIAEVPIAFTDRRLGKSKISTNIIYEGLIEPWRIRFSRI
ncbi:MAG: polyprenol monophosphomannose synthase [Candidatus Sungbacteria bacterium]|nr:polyprenol monophosphomannose synthase [Candidatus Sungbacteria bacterium]